MSLHISVQSASPLASEGVLGSEPIASLRSCHFGCSTLCRFAVVLMVSRERAWTWALWICVGLTAWCIICKAGNCGNDCSIQHCFLGSRKLYRKMVQKALALVLLKSIEFTWFVHKDEPQVSTTTASKIFWMARHRPGTRFPYASETRSRAESNNQIESVPPNMNHAARPRVTKPGEET